MTRAQADAHAAALTAARLGARGRALQAATDAARDRLQTAQEDAQAEAWAQALGRDGENIDAYQGLADLAAQAVALLTPWADRAGPPVRPAHWARMVAALQDAADLAAYAEADAADLAPRHQAAPDGLRAAEALAEASASLVEALSLTQEG